MRRASLLLGTVCTLALMLACFHAVLLRGESFAYRDAGHFYHPLYRVVQQEWAAGRWPLWNPRQNAGTPLLGLPMAAVLYPGKLIYAILPYSVAARSYVIVHELIALLGVLALARTLGLSGTAATIAGLGYAFGGPVLAMSSNIIYLVGAAWAPWGLRAIVRLAGPGRRGAVIELAAVLALQVLGGDPESAYLTAAAGVLFGVVLVPGREGSGRTGQILLLLVPGWIGVVLGADLAAPRGWLPAWLARGTLPWSAVGVVLVVTIVQGMRRDADGIRVLGGLALAGVLAAMLAAVQLGSSWEYARRTTRLGGGADPSRYDFSVEPYRLAEAVWPQVFGLEVPENATWLPAIPPRGERMVWSPSLYIGGFVLVLALAGSGLRDGPPWRRWLTIVAMVGVLAGMGRFAGPLWWARQVPGANGWLGPFDPPAGVMRPDAFLADGAGSPYGLLATFLPGFGMFRYPAKLLVFAALGASVLAGLGWDRLCRGEAAAKPARRWCLAALVLGVGLVVVVVLGRESFERWVASRVPPGSLYGPVDAAGALGWTVRALIQGAVVYAVGAVLTTWAAARPGWTGAGALILVTADLAMAGSRIVWTAPQAVFETIPSIVRLIEAAEKANPAGGPFRVHRVEQWHPDAFLRERSPERLAELATWELETIDRLHAEPFGLEYTIVRGIVDVGDYLDFFEARATRGRDERGVERTLYSFPRGGYDLWNARYFLMPVGLNGWMGPERGFTRIAPGDEVVGDPGRAREWIDRQGWQLLRNDRAMPRCWVVPSAVVVPPTEPGSPGRAEMVRALVEGGGFEPRRMAFVEVSEPGPLEALNRPPPPGPIGSATIVSDDPRRVEIRAVLRDPGLVILSDAFDPGWRLTIDDTPAPIWRANRLMRGAFVPAGEHRLVYTYQPLAFWAGGAVSAVGLIIVGWLGIRAWSTASRRGLIANPAVSRAEGNPGSCPNPR